MRVGLDSIVVGDFSKLPNRDDFDFQSHPNLSGIRVLIVDDNEMYHIVLGHMLDKWNVKYDHARNGQEAYDLARTQVYDLILMDLMMPIMDGFRSVRHLREIEETLSKVEGKVPGVPIIAISGSISDRVIDKLIQAGMNDYISKPFTPIDLYHKLSKYCFPNTALKSE